MATEITLPRKKHSHRCATCGQGVYCYKTRCTQPQRLETCRWCPPKPKREVLDYHAGLDIRNTKMLAPGLGLRYLEVIRAHEPGALIAVKWYRDLPATGLIVDFTPQTLPGMEHVPEERAEVLGLELAEELTAELATPKSDIERKAGEIETLSPLFRGHGPQGELF